MTIYHSLYSNYEMERLSLYIKQSKVCKFFLKLQKRNTKFNLFNIWQFKYMGISIIFLRLLIGNA